MNRPDLNEPWTLREVLVLALIAVGFVATLVGATKCWNTSPTWHASVSADLPARFGDSSPGSASRSSEPSPASDH